MNGNTLIRIAGLSGALAVIAGALGAHALKEILSVDQLASFKTAVFYHLIHSVVLLILATSGKAFHPKRLKLVTTLMICGMVLFSGSIYLLTLKGVLNMPFLSILGPVTPLGGLLIITGWITLGIGVKNNSKTS